MNAILFRARLVLAVLSLFLAAGHAAAAGDLIGRTEVDSRIFRNVGADGREFADAMGFRLGEAGSFMAQLMSFGLDDVTLTLVDRTRDTRITFGDVGAPYFSTGWLDLLPGKYRVVLDGTAELPRAFYSLAITAQPVPEPGHWALLLSGLLMIGLMSVRRTR